MRQVLIVLLGFLFALMGVPTYGQSQQEEVTTQSKNDKPWRKESKDPKKEKKKAISDIKKFKSMARTLLGQPHWSDRFMNLLDQETPKIALHPFKEEDLPISLSEAQIYVDGFLQALIREADGRYAVVGREELGAVISDINEMGTRSDSLNPLGDLIDRARSDLLAVGHLTLRGEAIILSYKMVETQTGRIVSTVQKSFKRKKNDEQTVEGGLSVNGAAQKAARTLMRGLPLVRKVMIQGITYQSSGVHTSFGRYFMELLSDHLRWEAASGPRNINDLDISDFIIEEDRFRGLKLAKGVSVEGEVLGDDPGNYIVRGSYWVFENHVDVRLQLVNKTGRSLSWRGRIVKSEIPPRLALTPPKTPIEAVDKNPLGPIDLYVSSNKGQTPLFKIGEEMVLVTKVAQDAYLSCYYIQADGAIFRIFPNKFISSSKVVGGFTQHIPARAMPFSFEFSPPKGVEAVKCYATDRDVLSEVKRQTGKAAFVPLPLENERELTKIYRSLSNVVLSEASLIVTVQ
ncbi:MAG: DUF4384 domain-containing protein [Methylocystaceae bacterium]|nr:DUF4384 domain-containing protein [Methylocystaceae bacterium]